MPNRHLSTEQPLPELEGALGGVFLPDLDASHMGHPDVVGLTCEKLQGVDAGPHVAV